MTCSFERNYRTERPNLQLRDENVFCSHVLSFAKTRQIIGNSSTELQRRGRVSHIPASGSWFFLSFLSVKKKRRKLVLILSRSVGDANASSASKGQTKPNQKIQKFYKEPLLERERYGIFYLFRNKKLVRLKIFWRISSVN